MSCEMNLLALGLVRVWGVGRSRSNWAGLPCNAETGQTKRLVRAYAVKHSTRVPEPRSTAPSFFHATPDSLRFQEPSLSASRSLPSFHRSASAPNCSTSSAILKVQSNGIFCGFLKSKSAIVLVRHHPLPQSRNQRLAVAVGTNIDHAFVGICRQLSRRFCRLLAPLARWNLSPFTGNYW